MTDSSRRNFLLGAAGLTGVAAAATVWPAASAAGAPPSAGRVAQFDPLMLDLGGDGKVALRSAEGGAAYGDVVEEADGRKHIAGVKYEDITVSMGAVRSKDLYEWVKSSFDGKVERRSGSIIVCDNDGTEVSRMRLLNAYMAEVGMPALDAASKDAAKMTIKLAPETTRRAPGSGQRVDVPKDNQKAWLPANFRLRIDGLEEACSRVNKIEAITVKQKVTENAVGETRDYSKEPAKVEIPNLVITLAESHAKGLYDWHEDFVIKGNNGQESEKGGSLEYLSSDLTTVLFTLTFSNLGIFKLTPDKSEAGGESIRRVKAEMYCEDVRFDYNAGRS